MNKDLIVLNKPKGLTSEAIRTLRTNLQFTLKTKKHKVIMVTSSIPGEGKSFISSNLACAFSMVDSKVLIVDCDLRKGRQHKIFRVPSDKGLSNLLIDDISAYKNYIQATNVKNLFLLPVGVVPPNPSELLSSDECNELFKLLKKDYDVIILDCPPINSVTDALILTSLADEAVLVSAYKKTPIDLLSESKKALDKTKIKIAGVIINKTEKKVNNYYYDKYYK